MSITFDMNYYKTVGKKKSLTHFYEETWDITDYFCYKCGEQQVYNEIGHGDFYVGSKYLCTTCGAESYLDNGKENCDIGTETEQRLEKLR